MEEKLSAYLDGELGDVERLEVERYLSANPKAARDLEKSRSVSQALHELFDHYMAAPLPPQHEELAEELCRELRQTRRGLPMRWAGLAAASVLAVVAAGWLVADYFPRDRDNPNLISLFENASQSPSGEDKTREGEDVVPESAVAVYSGDGAAADAQIEGLEAGEAGKARVTVPDFSNLGFTLVGTRMLAGDKRESMQLIYEANDGARIELFFGPSGVSERQSLTLMEYGPISVMAWHNEGRAYNLIGEADRETLLEMGRVVNSDWTGSLPSQSDD